MKTENKNSSNANPFENLLKVYKEFSVLDTELCKNNIDAISKLRVDIFENILKYYENYSTAIKEYTDFIKYPFEYPPSYWNHSCEDSFSCKNPFSSGYQNTSECQSSDTNTPDEYETTSEDESPDTDKPSNTDNQNEFIPTSENEPPYTDKSSDAINPNEYIPASTDESPDTDKPSDAINQNEFVPIGENESTDTDTPSDNDNSDDIYTFPASGHDICSFLTRYDTPALQIQAILKLDGRLDLGKLNKAIRMSVDAEPVFGCRFVKSDSPHWKRIKNIDEIAFCTLEETDNPDEAVNLFIREPLDIKNNANINAKIIRFKDYDILAIKINDACCDETYAKEYIQRLSDIYSSIDQNDNDFKPQSRVDSMINEDILFKELGREYPELIWNPLLGIPKTIWEFPWKNAGRDDTRYAVNRITQCSLKTISQYGKSRGATVNDLILTAIYRAMFKISKPIHGIPMDISSKIDLRKYINDARTQSVRNFSGEFITSIARVSNEPFEDTLSRVVNVTKDSTQAGNPTLLMPNKSRPAGISSAIGEEYLKKTYYSYFQNYLKHAAEDSDISKKYPNYVGNICFPEFSNLGDISNSLMRFGDITVSDAYMLPPVIRAPGFLLLANSYNDILTMSVGYYKDSISHKDIEYLLTSIEKELMRVCISDDNLNMEN